MIGIQRISLLGVVLVAVACDNGLSGPQGDPMSRNEAMAVAEGIVRVSHGAASAMMAAGGEGMPSFNVNAAQGSFSFAREATHPCPSGGSVELDVAVDGSFDKEAGSADFDVAGHQTHSACAFPYESVTFTITAAPRLVFSAKGAVENHEPTEPFVVNVEGALDWTASDGRRGRCPIKVDATIEPKSTSENLSALVCGHTFTEDAER